MKKFINTLLIPVAVLLLIGTTKVSAQEYGKGSMVFSAGYGFAAPGNVAFKGLVSILADSIQTGELSYMTLGPIYVKGEFAVSDKSGLGINVAYISNNATWTDDVASYDYSAKRTNVSIMARYNYYLQTKDKFELYGGLGAGVRLGGWKLVSDDPTFVDIPSTVAIPLALEATLGFRAYPIENIAIYGEFGIAKSLAQFGIAYKL